MPANASRSHRHRGTVEGATYVEIGERHADDSLIVDVVTGMLDDQTSFKAHGHTRRFRVSTRQVPGCARAVASQQGISQQ